MSDHALYVGDNVPHACAARRCACRGFVQAGTTIPTTAPAVVRPAPLPATDPAPPPTPEPEPDRFRLIELDGDDGRGREERLAREQEAARIAARAAAPAPETAPETTPAPQKRPR